MHLTRRMRLIWHKLWLIPLVGATADVVASEAAKLGGVTVPIPWLFSAIGVAGMLVGAVARAYSIPLIPEGLEGPDEALTRRSRILGERLGATPVRVFVSDLPKLRGKVDTFLDGHDLFVSKRVAELPEAARDFVLAQELFMCGPAGIPKLWYRNWGWVTGAATAIGVAVDLPFAAADHNSNFGIIMATIGSAGMLVLSIQAGRIALRGVVSPLGATGNLPAALAALHALAETDEQKKQAALDADALKKGWDSGGQKAVEASEWYQRERGVAAKAE